MNNKEKMNKLIDESTNGTITTKQVTNSNIHRGIIKKYVESGELYRFNRGIYIRTDCWEDDFYLFQYKYKRGIYSNETALYLLGYSDRTPAQYTMTFPQGYNAPSIKQENIQIKRANPDFYSIGVIEIKSPCGNNIQVYEIEKTLCDILRGKGSNIEIINFAMKKYVTSRDKNINKLMQYSELLHVKPKILRYLEVLL